MGHRELVIGAESWDAGGQAQFDFLKARGLQPHHYVLDMGCGPFRLGVRLIDYLEPEHYVGVDARQEALDAGIADELGAPRVAEKRPTLLCCSDFDLGSLPSELRFDFGWSYSVLTHLDAGRVTACVRAVVGRLARSGVYYATYDRAPGPVSLDHGTWHEHPFKVLQEAARLAGAHAVEVGPALVPQAAPSYQVVVAFSPTQS